MGERALLLLLLLLLLLELGKSVNFHIKKMVVIFAWLRMHGNDSPGVAFILLEEVKKVQGSYI